MIEARIEDLRNKLHVILENEEHNFKKILKISQELDELIVQYIHDNATFI